MKIVATLATPADLLGASTEVPEGWLVMNAPRPLYAPRIAGEPLTIVTGRNLRGVHYAIVRADDTATIERNVDLDARVVRFVTEADVVAFVRDVRGLDPAEHDLADMFAAYRQHEEK